MMKNETKLDVFKDALRALEEFGEQGSSWEMACDDLSARYADALSDDLPVIPQVWGNMIEVLKANDYPLSEMFVESDYNCDEQNLIARAWIDGYVVEDND